MTKTKEKLFYKAICPVCGKKLKFKSIEAFCGKPVAGPGSTIKGHYSVITVILEDRSISDYDRYEEHITSTDGKYNVLNFIHINSSIKNYSDLWYDPTGTGTYSSCNVIEDIDRTFPFTNTKDWEKEVEEFYKNYQLLE